MIGLLDKLSFVLMWAYAFVFFSIIKNFMPLRGNWLSKIAAFVVCGYLSDSIIYSNDFPALFGTMLFFFIYVLIFYRGALIAKISVSLVFYPALIAINYLMLDMGGRMYRIITHATFEAAKTSPELMLVSTSVHTFSLFLRLLFWIGAWLVLRKFLAGISSRLNTKMWMIVDMLMLASVVAIFTILYFMPENTIIAYPICFASIFSSFGCMYLASYICKSMETEYRAQELEMARNYYKDKIRDEERVRSIYHDMKNHLLVLESGQGTDAAKEMAQQLRAQIADYEDYIHTGNSFLDIIIKDKAEKMREKQIDFSAIIDFNGVDFIEPLDISALFGNGIDNAVEASEKLPEEERVILVKAGKVQSFVSVLIENNCLDRDNSNGIHTTKADSFLHGFGISNMERAAEKYGGTCTVKREKGKFTLKILIPIP